MIIPYKDIEPDTLNNLIEEYVTRDGTDNGYDQPLEDKVNTVLRLLTLGEVVIVYDQEMESVNIIPRKNVSEPGLDVAE